MILGSFFSIDDFPQPGGGGGFIGFDDAVPQPIQPEPIVEPSQPVAQIPSYQPVASKMRSSDSPHAVMISLFPKVESDDDTLCEGTNNLSCIEFVYLFDSYFLGGSFRLYVRIENKSSKECFAIILEKVFSSSPFVVIHS